MRTGLLIYVTALTLLVAAALPTRCPAEEVKQQLPHYTVIDLGTLGGTFSLAGGLSNDGWVEGYSTLPGDTALHVSLAQRSND